VIRAITALIVHVAFLISPTPASATDRYYPDITISSQSARYKLDAKSPDNQKPEGRQRAFARNFKYTLTYTQNNKILWTYLQKEAEASPVGAWVHDTGWVVVRTGWDDLMAFDPANGTITGKLNILEQFPRDERSKYVHQTTAGPMWSQSSRWSFLEVERKLCFVVRAHWGRRVIMDLASGKAVADPGAATTEQDRKWALATLREKVPIILKDETDHEAIRDVCAAIDMAAKDRIQEAAPLLEEAEKSEYVGSSGGIPVFFGDNKLPDGAIDPFWFSEFTIRHKAQTALRKLGRTPSEAPAISFNPVRRFDHKSMIRPAPTECRATALPKLREGLTPKEVLAAAGGPDASYRERHDIAWEYHVDGKDAHSVRVFWSQKVSPVVISIEKVTPPSWTSKDDVE